MRAAEEAAFARGIEVEALMDQAGAGVARAVRQFLSRLRESASFLPEKATTAATRSSQPSVCSGPDGRSMFASHFPKAICSELTRKKLATLRDGGRFRPVLD